MSGQRGFWLLFIGPILAGWLSAAALAAPWDRLLTLKRVEADPNKSYGLTEQDGPWMIMACSFSGDRAEQQARDLVLELRKRYKLEAFTYRRAFDLGDETYGRGVNRFGEPPRMRYQRGSDLEEVAVLVGNYPSVDDPEAQKTLRKLKYCRPKSLELDPSNPTARNLALWRLYSSLTSPESQERGPMSKAFITTNPALPKDYFVPRGLDPLVLEANEGVKHCLLDCPGKYTVQVATFRGRMVIKQREIAAINSGRKKLESELVEAAEKAHKLTEALRLKGYDAYEFHDRYASLVTVGSFDWVTRRLPDGRTEFNPAVQAVIDRFGPKQTNHLGRASGQAWQTGGLAQQTMVGIPFDLKPVVVHVPKRPISSAYNRQLTSLF